MSRLNPRPLDQIYLSCQVLEEEKSDKISTYEYYSWLENRWQKKKKTKC